MREGWYVKFMMWVGISLVTLVLQSTLFTFFKIMGVVPDVLMVLVIFLALFTGPFKGGISGFIAGLLEDIVRGEFIGLNAFIKMCIGALVGLIERRVYKENFLVPTLTVLVGTLLGGVLFLLLSHSFGLEIPLASGVRFIVLPMCLYNSIVGVFIYKPLYKLHEYLKGRGWSFRHLS